METGWTTDAGELAESFDSGDIIPCSDSLCNAVKKLGVFDALRSFVGV